MCAITGLFASGSTNISLQQLHTLAATLKHRGPDGEGYMIDDDVGLYHLRLAIHDLSASGQQPFTTPAGTQAICNGEIYNYINLKDQLARADRDIYWHSTSDCEVIPHLYEKYGVDFVEHLRGMYAIALFDPAQRQLLLCRDPFGMKQLYYYQDEQGFYFASELRALQHALKLEQVDHATVTEVAQLHFATRADTAIKGIQRILPGETLIIKAGKIHSRGFYPSKLGFNPPARPTMRSTDAYLADFERVFSDTVKLHLQADVPVGLFLSGGIDSTCLLTMIARLNSAPIHTYTIGFNSNETHDERDTAAFLAEQFHTQHTEINFSEADFWQLLPQAIEATDDPTADYAIVPTFKLAQAAAKDVTVVLSGEGGDEVFAGYGRYRSFTRPIWQKRRELYAKGDLTRLGLLKENGKQWRTELNTLKKSCFKQHYDRLYTAQTIDMHTWLPNDLLIKLDRCLMWHSLEGRTPFLDKAMLEFANQLPNSYKLHGKQGKWMLRLWLSRQLEGYDAFSHKRGFSVPIRDWLDNRRSWLQEYLPQQAIVQELCHRHKLERMLAQPLTKTTAKATWSLLYIALWTEIHVTKSKLYNAVY